jgi:hypothetical protein
MPSTSNEGSRRFGAFLITRGVGSDASMGGSTLPANSRPRPGCVSRSGVGKASGVVDGSGKGCEVVDSHGGSYGSREAGTNSGRTISPGQTTAPSFGEEGVAEGVAASLQFCLPGRPEKPKGKLGPASSEDDIRLVCQSSQAPSACPEPSHPVRLLGESDDKTQYWVRLEVWRPKVKSRRLPHARTHADRNTLRGWDVQSQAGASAAAGRRKRRAPTVDKREKEWKRVG